jgi:SAM-dependent methyltransferase
MWLGWERRQRFDKFTGYLRYPGKNPRLLDIGCGNGCFLLQMQTLGWEVSGIEPDPKAAAAATASGLNVKVGLLQDHSLPEAHYDAVSLNHVIEHLHDPVATLRICRKILKPGGSVFIATPNFAAGGHRLFGSDWFPLDPPRHLVLFTPESLRRALRTAGLEPDPAIRLRLAAKEMFMRSVHLQHGNDPMRQEPPLSLAAKFKVFWLARQADRATRANAELTEELCLLGHRPREE